MKDEAPGGEGVQRVEEKKKEKKKRKKKETTTAKCSEVKCVLSKVKRVEAFDPNTSIAGSEREGW